MDTRAQPQLKDAAMSATMNSAATYDMDIIVSGFPGKSVCHGGLGWSTIVLLRGTGGGGAAGRIALIDAGSFGMRNLLIDGLAARGLVPADVTDLLLTHSHHDHSVNWTLFPTARIVIGDAELTWSLQEPWGRTPVPELYVKELNTWPTLVRVQAGAEAMPGITTHLAPGHTPGCLVYVLAGAGHDIIFTGDAAKNRAELMSGNTDMTYDATVSRASIEMIWDLWRRRPGSVLVPGHDLPMVQEGGVTRYIGRREAGIKAWYGDTMEQTTVFALTV
jgi:N-acyl homoserine lactone hydrolase